MITLGITDGHTATACLLVNGRILGMVSEERFARKKGWGGIPKESVRWLLESTGIDGSQIDVVGVSSLVQPVWDIAAADLSLLRRVFRGLTHTLPGGLLATDFVVKRYVEHYAGKRNLRELDLFLSELGIDPLKRRMVEHHTAHAATAYYLSPHFAPDKETLVITIDGSGDGLCASTSVGSNYHMQRLHTIASYHSIGEFYLRVTQYLGMKPAEHEYKVMGLAPYAPAEQAQKAYSILKTFYQLTPDGLSFVNRTGHWGSGLLKLFERRLRGLRFDAVAAGAQRLIETLVVSFVRNWVNKSGIRNVACAGGVFMNVKANMLISQLPEVAELFFVPSPGDESTALGAAVQAYVDEALASPGRDHAVEPLETLYLGPEYSNDAVLAELHARSDLLEWEKPASMLREVARLLAENKIVALFAGRMEWGARALGNRSILANPKDPLNIRRINRAIKMRDFWMPFSPAILHERRHDYIVNPRDCAARYMINAFPATPLAISELICGLHPSDLTCRPQVVTERDNPDFYAILKHFERLTGIGGVLNTSFNLHGEPIVCTPADAVSTFLRSDVDFLVLSDFLVWEKGG